MRSDCLLPLAEQLARLRRFDAECWGGLLGAAQLDAVATDSDHVQRFNDLEVLHVEGETPAATLRLWWTACALAQPSTFAWRRLALDDEHVRLGLCTRAYTPGIHRVRLDLSAHWEPVEGRSPAGVRIHAEAAGQTLAHGEALAAYALNDRLAHAVSEAGLPTPDLVGYELSVPGREPWTHVPHLNWDPAHGALELFGHRASQHRRGWSAPVVLG